MQVLYELNQSESQSTFVLSSLFCALRLSARVKSKPLKRLSMIGNILEKEIPLPFLLHLATNVFTCCWPRRLLECNYMRLMIIG